RRRAAGRGLRPVAADDPRASAVGSTGRPRLGRPRRRARRTRRARPAPRPAACRLRRRGGAPAWRVHGSDAHRPAGRTLVRRAGRTPRRARAAGATQGVVAGRPRYAALTPPLARKRERELEPLLVSFP